MADDIDDLLDEVETKFCATTPVKKDSASRRQERRENAGSPNSSKNNKSIVTRQASRESQLTSSTKKSIKRPSGEDDLKSMIDDIIDGPEPPSNLQRQNSQTSHKRVASISHRRCNPVYLGGSADVMGLSSAVAQRMCDQLRCTSCDFKIVSFDNYAWDSSCEYLFFRNNVPDFNKLSAKLKKRKGSRAYACQCMWRTIKEISKVEEDPELKWVCGKHNIGG